MKEPSGEIDVARLRAGIVEAQQWAVDDLSVAAEAKRRIAAAFAEGRLPWPVRRSWLARALRPSLFAAAALAGVGAAAVVWSHLTQPLAFDVGQARVPGRSGPPLAAPPDAALPLHFSDGTALSLAPRARLRVAALTSHGSEVVLERGRLDAQVVHRRGTRWRVSAGPFVVAVTGTRFTVDWNPDTREFALALEDGAVIVSGPTLATAGRPIVRGERLHVSLAAPPPRAAPAPAGEEPEPPDPPAGERTLRDPTSPAPAERPRPVARRVPDRSWKELARAGRYGDALRALGAAGFRVICDEGGEADLLLLGTSARLAGVPSRAAQAFTSARARFPGTHDAALAAFALGRVSFDSQRSFTEAADWFETYLREEPHGQLAREAAGRLIEARQRGGDIDGARRAAASYLRAYGSGPHARLARSLTAR